MKVVKSYYMLITLLLAISNHTFGQGTQLLREPSIYKDKVVFVYANDLWLSNIDGTVTKRLTSNIGAENHPHFSPDGNTIAFTGQYDGNTDVYTLPTSGGQPKRLTWHPGEDRVSGWTPNGKNVLFNSGREGAPTKEEKFYTISIDGGMPEALSIPRAYKGEISDDGKYIAYQLFRFWDPEWRNYRGGQAKPTWIVNTKDYSLKTTPRTDNERHTDPVWHKGIVYFLSERDYANNIWSFNPEADELKQMTFHKDFDVKSLDAGPEQIVYEQGGYLHLLNPENGESKQLNINVEGDFDWARERWENIPSSRLSNASLSPEGNRALFEYRGEIFTVPKEYGDWRNISHNSAAADRYPSWSPDGDEIAWFTDESGEYQLVISDQKGMQIKKTFKIPNPTFFFSPVWSPDGKFIAFTDTDYNLWYIQLENGKLEKADTDRYAHPNRTMQPVWSPDSKWIAYAKLLDTQLKAIKVYNVETKQIHQLTDGMSDAMSPVWDASGKYLYFLSSTNYALNTGWLDMSSFEHPITRALYVTVLSKDEKSPLVPQSDEAVEANEEKKEDKKDDKPTVNIDFDGIEHRMIALDIPEKDYTYLLAGQEGYVFYSENIPGQPIQNLHRYHLQEKKAEEFLTNVSEASVSHDRKSLLYKSGSTWDIVGTAGNGKGGDKLSTSGMQVKVNPQDEWQQIFREGWRYQRDFLYVDNVHGAPWRQVYDWYQPWVKHVKHRTDLNYIVDIIGGEVSVGHSYTRGGDMPDVKHISIGLLGADFIKEKQGYKISKIYSGGNWNANLKAPLVGPGINVNEGDYLVKVNGKIVETDKNLYSYFEATVGKQVEITVNSKPDLEGAKTFTVIPISNEFAIRRFEWIEENRKKVDQLSGGKLAYVYVPNTGQQGYEYFNRYYFAQQDKKGAVIDERNNGGGSAADYMVDVMARDLHGYFNSKVGDHKPFTTPMAGIWGPKVMIINERAGSGGDLLPYLFHKMEIGTLVGTRTWGGLVGTWDTPPFVDGGRMVAPRGGFYDLNGEWAVEGVGISPDVEVMQKPADIIAGKDPQLEKAVEIALEKLKTEGVELKPEPAAPIKWRRPKKG
ncbi:S41 family peptidase [Chondrinema litorale]|uniref:S41 family peptidase n=1 Tax=Chondrinema litorale TaxID=2994555 RepID=UPI003D6E1061